MDDEQPAAGPQDLGGRGQHRDRVLVVEDVEEQAAVLGPGRHTEALGATVAALDRDVPETGRCRSFTGARDHRVVHVVGAHDTRDLSCDRERERPVAAAQLGHIGQPGDTEAVEDELHVEQLLPDRLIGHAAVAYPRHASAVTWKR